METTQSKIAGFFEKATGLPKVLGSVFILGWVIIYMWTMHGLSPLDTIAYLSKCHKNSVQVHELAMENDNLIDRLNKNCVV